MKRGLKIIIFLLLFTFITSIKSFAKEQPVNNDGIVLDGSFDDWDDKPSADDFEHDIKSPELDFKEVGYFADSQYLYLYVERQAAEKSQPWHFSVVILNAAKGAKQLQYPFGPDKPVYAPQFDINTDFNDNKGRNEPLISVGFNGEDLESTFSASKNGKEIEFRVPLEKVGLNGLNKEIHFMLKSDIDPKSGEIDWAPDGRPIIFTTGPTFWQMSSLIFLIAVSLIAYRIYRKNKKLDL